MLSERKEWFKSGIHYDEESVKLSKAEKEQMLEEARAYNKEMLGNIDLIDPFSQKMWK